MPDATPAIDSGTPPTPRIGSLFSGYGGLDMGVQSILGGSVAWHVEYDANPSRILAHHWPDAPNYGDVTKVNWSAVEPVDVITGGSPCQDLSSAGRRGGMNEGTRSNLWVQMREAIAALRPGLVVWENVRGAYSAAASSEMEPCPGCVGDGLSEPPMRALHRVLGDLASLGYDARWCGLRAADVGAPHHRFRVFITAYPQSAGPRYALREGGRSPQPRGVGGARTLRDVAPTAYTAGSLGRQAEQPHLLQGQPGQDEPGERTGPVSAGRSWGAYTAGIRRWERVLGRPAPSPAEPGPDGRPRVSPAFAEWMMGLPRGHVTDPAIWADMTPVAAAEAQLKACGNGVVPQQAAHALTWLMRSAEAAA